MSYQVLARKYRPQKFSEVIGQEHVTRTLKNAIQQERIAHGYIFSGHRGIGKTTIARILAMALNCRSAEKPVSEPCGVCDSCVEIRAGNAVDVIEIDAATNRGIDEIRELREAARYRPARDRYKIYILDEAHQITDAAFNALLKILEEPPGHVVFMMATTQPEDIPQTIRSRCQHFSFRAVKFEEILSQLRDLSGRENITADDDALAILAEAGDGSMRDALSILDQAIASCDGSLTAEAVRQLVGTAPSGLLEEVMRAVADGSSETVLRLVDKLLADGQNPAHFAKQMVRFLRNAVVAKVAGGESSLLQISSDERQRVARLAELFSEEDLTRHLQIMLRTHGELGYRQEQRFHLELGLLKMAHAQRLLPIEQLLSEAGVANNAGASANASRPVSKPASLPEARRADTTPAPRANYVSPFAADSARKSSPKSEMSADDPQKSGPRLVSASPNTPVVMGATALDAEVEAAPAPVITPQPEIVPEIVREIVPQITAQETGSEAAPEQVEVPQDANLPQLREAILNAAADAGHRMVVGMLETGEWKFEGNELLIKVAASAFSIDMTLGADAKKLVVATASRVAGRAVRLKVIPGGVAQAAPPRTEPSKGGGRGRAEQDPIVRRVREKFSAEIRTIIDYKEKR